MLNSVIQFALRQRLLVVAVSMVLIGFGTWQATQTEIDVFPNLNRPRVVVITEAPGMAPEEVEALITFPLETALNGANGVLAVRSSSGVGISVIYVEFDWGTDIYNDRQIVNERLALALEQLPSGVKPTLAPISSIMGQIVMMGMWSEENEKTLLGELDAQITSDLNSGRIPPALRKAINQLPRKINGGVLAANATVTKEKREGRWKVHDTKNDRLYLVRKVQGKRELELHRLTSDLQLRTLADWVVRKRLLTIPGVSQVFTMGGGRKQFQVLVDPNALLRYGISLHEVKTAVRRSNRNNTGGYLDQQGPNEFLVRALGRVQAVEDLQKLSVGYRDGRSIPLTQVARVVEAAQVKRGDSSAFVKKENGEFSGGPAVVLTINKQPGADTREITDHLRAAIRDLEPSLPPDVNIVPGIYSQRQFIDRAIDNVIEALADGGVLVVILLFLFLLNFRTTFITLTAIPLSLVIAALVFAAMGVSINTMTLGGLAVAIGELVDDAIVDVENIFRRLRLNREAANPKNPLLVVYQASVEIRKSIVFGTMIVVLVFLPLFALEGLEGRLYAPLGLAYMVSILASLAVSLTLTPVLCYLLLTRNRIWQIVAPALAVGISASIFYWVLPRIAEPLQQSWMTIPGPVLGMELVMQFPVEWSVDLTPKLFWTLAVSPLFWLLIRLSDRTIDSEREGRLLRILKWLIGGTIRASLQFPLIPLAVAVVAVAIAGVRLSRFQQDPFTPFNEGSVQLNVILPPGTSLRTSNRISRQVESRLRAMDFVKGFVRRTGRAELDEHAEGVNTSEIIIHLDPNSPKSREQILDEIRETMAEIPGITTSVEQPLAHLISHMISGVKAQVAVKLYGNDLSVLRRKASEIKAVMKGIPGVKSPIVEPQVTTPQLRIEVDRDKLLKYGLTPDDVNEYVETAMNGQVVSQVLIDQRTFDLLIRFDNKYREDLHALRRLTIDLPIDRSPPDDDENKTETRRHQKTVGGKVPLESVAKVYFSGGPNTINREQVRRRIVVQCNVAGRGMVDVVEEIRQRLKPIQRNLPPGYYVEFSGQFESAQRASKRIIILFVAAMIGVFLILYSMFRSVNFSLQVMVALPMAFIGSVAALVVTDQKLTVAAMVGFISLGGIASRNGILLLNHYLHLVKHEGETWSKQMIIRAGKERLAPVLMTALTSGIGLLPLAMAAGEPGKEVLYPVATVIIGGLISSTLLEFIVRPALFWTFGRGVGERLVQSGRDEVTLLTNEDESKQITDQRPSDVSDSR